MFQYNHNKHYTDLLLRQIPSGCQNALDVGCGDGYLARRLANRFNGTVTGIDSDRSIIARAQVITNDRSIRFVEADFMRYHFDEQFDFISAVASLHHMPFDLALEKMASLLRPGGVLAVLGLFRETSLIDAAVAFVAAPVNVFYAALSHGQRSKFASGAPTRPPDMSLREICETVSSNLPNADLRRLLLWRYLLTWKKPQEVGPGYVEIRNYSGGGAGGRQSPGRSARCPRTIPSLSRAVAGGASGT